jgi:hypothetical protein
MELTIEECESEKLGKINDYRLIVARKNIADLG